MLPRILIADPDEAFGLMLKQVLELNGDYSAEHASTSAAAVAAAQKQSPDLLIADMAIADVSTLVASIRHASPQTRVMLIPLGDALPNNAQSLDVQGTLTKPFFIGDLGEQIANVLGIPVRPLVELPPPPEKISDASKPFSVLQRGTAKGKPRLRQRTPTPTRSTAAAPTNGKGNGHKSEPPTRAPLVPETRQPEPLINTSLARPRVRPSTSPTRATPTFTAALPPNAAPAARSGDGALDVILLKLANEIRAEAVLVIKDAAVLAQRSNFNGARVEMFVERIVRWRKAASELSSFVGERSRFQQSNLEGDRYHLYAYDVSESVLLVTVCRNDIPFGTLRLNIRSAASEISKQLR